MASKIELILDNIATWTPTYDSDVSIGCWNIDDIKETLVMQTPKRVLGVIGSNPMEGSAFIFSTLGQGISSTWKIVDTLYLAPAGEMAGLRRWSGPIVRYIQDYVEDMRSNRSPVTQAKINRISALPGIFDWGNDQFYGVEITIEIQEQHN